MSLDTYLRNAYGQLMCARRNHLYVVYGLFWFNFFFSVLFSCFSHLITQLSNKIQSKPVRLRDIKWLYYYSTPIYVRLAHNCVLCTLSTQFVFLIYLVFFGFIIVYCALWFSSISIRRYKLHLTFGHWFWSNFFFLLLIFMFTKFHLKWICISMPVKIIC